MDSQYRKIVAKTETHAMVRHHIDNVLSLLRDEREMAKSLLSDYMRNKNLHNNPLT